MNSSVVYNHGLVLTSPAQARRGVCELSLLDFALFPGFGALRFFIV